MQAGDRVKVLVRENVWRKGTVICLKSPQRRNEPTIIKVGHGEYSSYREQDFTSGVKRLQEQSDEEHNENLTRDLPLGLAMVQEAIAALLPGEVVSYKEADQSISGYHGAVTLDPVQYDVETIGSFIERTGYQVTVWVYSHATHWQPEEYSDALVGTYPTIGAAVKVFLETIFKLKNEDYWQAKGDQALAEEWARDQV